MTIIRIVALDPSPRTTACDLITWQVPENSRAYELLVEMLEARDIDYDLVTFAPRKKKSVLVADLQAYEDEHKSHAYDQQENKDG